MARNPKYASGATKRISINFDPEVMGILHEFQTAYPGHSPADFVNAAVKYLKKQAGDLGLNANLEPVNTQAAEQRMHQIAAEVIARYTTTHSPDARDGPTKATRQANQRNRP